MPCIGVRSQGKTVDGRRDRAARYGTVLYARPAAPLLLEEQTGIHIACCSAIADNLTVRARSALAKSESIVGPGVRVADVRADHQCAGRRIWSARPKSVPSRSCFRAIQRTSTSDESCPSSDQLVKRGK